ncbi:MAG: hypothetical protein ACR2O5_01160 [Thiogranum sp.]
MTLREIMFSGLVIMAVANSAIAQEQDSGADASNPTAAVNYQDARYRYFDLDQGADKHSFETEGAYMLHPRFKLTMHHGVDLPEIVVGPECIEQLRTGFQGAWRRPPTWA